MKLRRETGRICGPLVRRGLHDRAFNTDWRCHINAASVNRQRALALACLDQEGYGLDEVVQSRRDTKAAKRLLIRQSSGTFTILPGGFYLETNFPS